jgi:hypothetical protein
MLTAQPRVVLATRIVSGAGGTFSVEIDDSAAALREEECFLFALHYYARVLFELMRDDRSVLDLPAWMDAIAQTAIDGDTDLFGIAGVEGALVRNVHTPAAETSLTMRVSGARHREIVGDFAPLQGAVLARSALAVAQAVLPRLSPAMRETVPSALANMNASYELTHRYSDPSSQREVPAIAYLAASFI